MKKQTRNLCIAAAALVILGGIYLAVSSREEQPETVAVGNLADMDVTGFSYSNADGTWNLPRQTAHGPMLTTLRAPSITIPCRSL